MFDSTSADFLLMPEPTPGFSITDLRRDEPFRTRRVCPVAAPGEIIVCGRQDPFRYRLAPLMPAPFPVADNQDLPFGIDLAPSVRLGLRAFQSTLPNGTSAPGAGLTFRIRF